MTASKWWAICTKFRSMASGCSLNNSVRSGRHASPGINVAANWHAPLVQELDDSGDVGRRRCEKRRTVVLPGVLDELRPRLEVLVPEWPPADNRQRETRDIETAGMTP